GVAQIRFHRAALEDLTADLRRFEDVREAAGEKCLMRFENEIDFRDVTFTYPVAATPALNRISLSIPKNKTIGLVGTSGSGKTTLVDLLLGLYSPDSGQILVDGIPLTAQNVKDWLSQVGYVPQQIFLSDDTIA